MTRKQMLAQIAKNISEARTARNITEISYWQDIDWMARRPSMKNYTLDQLIERHRATSVEHNINTVSVKIN